MFLGWTSSRPSLLIHPQCVPVSSLLFWAFQNSLAASVCCTLFCSNFYTVSLIAAPGLTQMFSNINCTSDFVWNWWFLSDLRTEIGVFCGGRCSYGGRVTAVYVALPALWPRGRCKSLELYLWLTTLFCVWRVGLLLIQDFVMREHQQRHVGPAGIL